MAEWWQDELDNLSAGLGRDGIRHGTNAGFVQHSKRRVPSCEACREARREYQADYRRRLRRAS